MRSWVTATALLTLLVACSAGTTPWLAAIAGAFTPPDFAQDVAAARAFASGTDPYVGNVAARHADVLRLPARDGYPYLPHPPFAILLTVPFALLSFDVASHYWFATCLALCFVLAVVLASLVMKKEGGPPSLRDAFVGFAALLMWPPVLYNLEKGQFSILLAVLIAVGYLSLARSDSWVTGVCVGLAAAIKIFPGLLAVFLLLRRRRAAIWFGLAAIAATTLPCVWVGWRVFPEFIAQSAGNVSYWQTWPAVTYSFQGLAARLFVGGEWSRAVIYAPSAANLMAAVASAVLVAIASYVTLRCGSDSCDAPLFAIWSVVLVPLNPLAMGHNGVLLALPVVLIGKALANDLRLWPKLIWSAGVVLVSIPRQTIFEAAPIPVTPWRSFAVVALPLWGALLLFSAGIAASCARAAAISVHRIRDEALLSA